jgi:hypothetical protein
MSPAPAIRWLIRREHIRATRFGEPLANSTAWGVTPITGRHPNRQRLTGPTFFPSRAAAFRYVDQEIRRTYRKKTP